MRIFLIGFMGVGKSYLGKELSKRLGFSFLDLDEAIAQQVGMPIPEIFKLHGEEGFREIEASALRATEGLKTTVIATGGGTPCFYGNMNWMNDNGITVYLMAEASFLAQRLLRGKVERPLLAQIEDEALAQFIASKLAERQQFYSLCHLQLAITEDGFKAIENLEVYLKRFFRP